MTRLKSEEESIEITPQNSSAVIPQKKTVELDPTQVLSAKQMEYLLFIITYLGNVRIVGGYYRLYDQGQPIEVHLTHTLIKYRQQSAPGVIRCEILEPTQSKEGAFGQVRESLLKVIVVRNNHLIIKTRKEQKKRAIKIIYLRLQSEEDIQHEADMIEQSASRLRCKPPIFDASYGYLIMTYIEGITIDRLVKQFDRRQTNLDYLSLLYIIRDMLDQVQKLHQQDIIHHDIKDLNFIINVPKRTATLVDYSFACVSPQQTSSPIIKGSPRFIAPETLYNAEISKEGDVFSLGQTIVDLLSKHQKYHTKQIRDSQLFSFFTEKQRAETFKDLYFNRPIPEDKSIRDFLQLIVREMTRFDKLKRTKLELASKGIDLLIKIENLRLKTKRHQSTQDEWDLTPGMDGMIRYQINKDTSLVSAINSLERQINRGIQRMQQEQELAAEFEWDLSPGM